jgi:hypothetical protein
MQGFAKRPLLKFEPKSGDLEYDGVGETAFADGYPFLLVSEGASQCNFMNGLRKLTNHCAFIRILRTRQRHDHICPLPEPSPKVPKHWPTRLVPLEGPPAPAREVPTERRGVWNGNRLR